MRGLTHPHAYQQWFTKITLKDVLHTLDIALMLVSVSLINQAGYTVTFKDGTSTICKMTYKLVGHFPKRDGLYKVCWNLVGKVIH